MARGKSLATAFVDIKPDGSRFPSELKTQIQSKTGAAGKDVGNTFGTSLLAGMGAVLTAGVVIDFFKGAIREAQEAAKVQRLTAAAIKSTGGAANVTAGQVGALADRLADLSGVDDDVIQSSAQVLLSFTRVRNEAGKGNDIFDQGTEAALNLSAALGKDLQGSITMVGKALNDPIAGLTALSKAGIQFTEQQKEQIRGFVEAGDVMSAQKIILAELTTQFGGAAAAAASPADKARVAWGEFQEQVGEKLLPTLNAVLNFANSNKDWLLPLVGSVAGLAVVIGSVIAATRAWAAVQSVMGFQLDSGAAKAKRYGVGIVGLLIASEAISQVLARDVNPQLEAVVSGLGDAGAEAELAGESARVLGRDMEILASGLKHIDELNGFEKFIDNIPGVDVATVALEGASEAVTAFDASLAQLAREGRGDVAMKRLEQAAAAAGISVEEAKKKLPEYAAAAEVAARSTTKLATATDRAAAEGDRLIDTWRTLNNTMLAADDSLLAAHLSLDGVKEAFEEGSKSIEGNTREATENRVALERSGLAAQEAARDQLKNGASHAEVTKILDDFKEATIAQSGAVGAEADAIRNLADQLFRIPPEVDTKVRIQIITEEILRSARTGRGFQAADGGIVKFFADGGRENHVAQIVKPGTWRIWGEDETGGEAYIPLALSKRARSEDILGEVARQFGLGLIPAGAGSGGSAGSMGSVGSMDGGGIVRMHPDDLNRLARIIESRPVEVWVGDQAGRQADQYRRAG